MHGIGKFFHHRGGTLCSGNDSDPRRGGEQPSAAESPRKGEGAADAAEGSRRASSPGGLHEVLQHVLRRLQGALLCIEHSHCLARHRCSTLRGCNGPVEGVEDLREIMESFAHDTDNDADDVDDGDDENDDGKGYGGCECHQN